MPNDSINEYIELVSSLAGIEEMLERQIDVLSTISRVFSDVAKAMRDVSGSGRESAIVGDLVSSAFKKAGQGFLRASEDTTTYISTAKHLRKQLDETNPLVEGLKGGVIDLGAAVVGLVVSAAIDFLSDLEEKEKRVQIASQDLSPLLRDMGNGLLQSSYDAIEALDGLVQYRRSVDDLIDSHAKLVLETGKKVYDINVDIALVDQYMQTIHELSEKSRLSADDQAKLQLAVEGVNSMCGTNIEIIDGLTGKMSQSIESIDSSTEAWKRNNMAQSAQEQNAEYSRQLIENTMELEAKRLELIGIEGNLNNLLNDENGIIIDNTAETLRLKNEIEKLEAEEERLTKQIDSLNDSYIANTEVVTSSCDGLIDYIDKNATWSKQLEDNEVQVGHLSYELSRLGVTTGELAELSDAEFASLAASFTGNADDIMAKCAELGIYMPGKFREIAETLGPEVALGYLEGLDPHCADEVLKEMGVDSIEALKVELGISSPSKRMAQIGTYAAEGFAKGISDDVTSALAAEALASGALAAMGSEAAPDKTNLIGKDASSGFAQGIGDGLKAVDTEGKVISAAAKAGLRSENGNATSWGNDLVGGLASGIRNAVGLVTNAASFIAGSIKSFLHFSRPDEGPLKDYERWMPDMVFGLALSMRKAAPVLFAEARALAQGISENINEWELSSASLTKGTAAGLTAYRPDAVALQGREATNNYYTIGDVSYTPDSRVAQLMSELTDILIINRNMEVTSYA